MSKTLRSIGAALCLTAALSTALGGCVGRDDATDEILHRLDTMQREIEDLRAGSTGSSASDGTTSSDSGTATDAGSSASTQAAPTDQAGFEAAIADLESRASDAVATADAVAVPSAPADRPQAYFDATRPLEALDDEIDRLDDQVEDALKYIKENDVVTVRFYKGAAFSVECENFVELKIVEAEPGVKGNTATNATKMATLETGAKIQVPMFVNEGEVIRVDTRTGEYMERVK